MEEQNVEIQGGSQGVSQTSTSDSPASGSEGKVSRQDLQKSSDRLYNGGVDKAPAGEPDTGKSTVVETNVSDKPADKSPDLDKARAHDKKQISKLVAQKHALKEEIARLLEENKKFNQKFANEPNEEDFKGDINAYNRAKLKFDIDKENGDLKIQEAKSALKDKIDNEWTERCRSTVSDYDKFSQDYKKYYDWLHENEPVLVDFARDSAVGPKLIEDAFLDFKNPDIYSDWRARSTQGKIQLLAQLESQLINQMNGKYQKNHAQDSIVPAKSKAPAPVKLEKVPPQAVEPKSQSMKSLINKSAQRMFGR